MIPKHNTKYKSIQLTNLRKSPPERLARAIKGASNFCNSAGDNIGVLPVEYGIAGLLMTILLLLILYAKMLKGRLCGVESGDVVVD